MIYILRDNIVRILLIERIWYRSEVSCMRDLHFTGTASGRRVQPRSELDRREGASGQQRRSHKNSFVYPTNTTSGYSDNDASVTLCS